MTALDEAFDPADAERADAEYRLRWFRDVTGRNLIVNPAVGELLASRGVPAEVFDVSECVPDVKHAPGVPFVPRVHEAAFTTTCPACGGSIIPGDEIRLDIEHEPRVVETGLAWVHAVCPTPRGTSTCPVCFLERPCPCEDGQ